MDSPSIPGNPKSAKRNIESPRINKSGTNSCILLKAHNFANYCHGGSIKGVVIPEGSRKIIKTLYGFDEHDTFGEKTYKDEIKAANILVKIDPRQEKFLYIIGACELKLPKNEENIRKLDEECKYDEHEHQLPKIIYLLELQYGGKSLDTINIVYSDEELLEIIHKISGLLTFLHDNLISHNDFHAGNIVIDENSNVKIIDFSLLKTHNRQTDPDFISSKKRDLEMFQTVIVSLATKLPTNSRLRKSVIQNLARSKIAPNSINEILSKLSIEPKSSSSSDENKKRRKVRKSSSLSDENKNPGKKLQKSNSPDKRQPMGRRVLNNSPVRKRPLF